MKSIAIIGAMEEEILILRQKITGIQTEIHAGFEYYIGYIYQHKIILLKSGIGKVNASIGATILCDKYQPELIINTGSAGGFVNELNVGDVVISSSVCHHDFDLSPFGYKYGQVPEMPEKFLADDNLVHLAKFSVKSLPEIKCMTGLIATGDRFMYEPEDVIKTRKRFPEMIAVEMEAAAIAQVSYVFGIPFVVIRALSDIAGKENVKTFDEFLQTAAKNSSTLILDILKTID